MNVTGRSGNFTWSVVVIILNAVWMMRTMRRYGKFNAIYTHLRVISKLSCMSVLS